MEQSSSIPTEIIWLCKLTMKIQSREELIKIIACYYFNINSLFSHSCHCMPSCNGCGPTGWGNGVDWKSVVAEHSAWDPGEEARYHRLSTHLCLRGAWDSDSEWGTGEQDANLHPPRILHPPSPRVPSACPPSGSSSSSNLGHLCWGPEPGEPLWGLGTLCPPAEAPHDLPVGHRQGYYRKQHAEDATEATNCYRKGYSTAMSC